ESSPGRAAEGADDSGAPAARPRRVVHRLVHTVGRPARVPAPSGGRTCPCPGKPPTIAGLRKVLSENDLLSLIQAAGWPVWFLIVASIAAVALIIERFLSLKRSKVLPDGLLDEVLALRRAQPVTP